MSTAASRICRCCGGACGCATSRAAQACVLAVLPLRVRWELQTYAYTVSDFYSIAANVAYMGSPARTNSQRASILVHGVVGDITWLSTNLDAPCTARLRGLYIRQPMDDGSVYVFDTLLSSGLPSTDFMTDSSLSATENGAAITLPPLSDVRLSDIEFKPDGTLKMELLSFVPTGSVEGISPYGYPIGFWTPLFEPSPTFSCFDGAHAATTPGMNNLGGWTETRGAAPTGQAACAFPLTSVDASTVYSHSFTASTGAYSSRTGVYSTLDANGTTGYSDETRKPLAFKITDASVDVVPNSASLDNVGCRQCARAYRFTVHYGSPINETVLDEVFVQKCLTATQVAALNAAAQRSTFSHFCMWVGASTGFQVLRMGPQHWGNYNGGLCFKGTGDCPDSITEGIARFVRNPVAGADGRFHIVAVTPTVSVTPVDIPTGTPKCYCDCPSACDHSAITLVVAGGVALSLTSDSSPEADDPCLYLFEADSNYYGSYRYNASTARYDLLLYEYVGGAIALQAHRYCNPGGTLGPLVIEGGTLKAAHSALTAEVG